MTRRTVFLSDSESPHFSSFTLPLEPMVPVCRTEGDPLEEFRLIKIHFELIPEWTKWVSILQKREKHSLNTHRAERQIEQDPELKSQITPLLLEECRRISQPVCPHQLHGKKVKH